MSSRDRYSKPYHRSDHHDRHDYYDYRNYDRDPPRSERRHDSGSKRSHRSDRYDEHRSHDRSLSRIEKRHEIMKRGVSSLWGASPSPPRSRSESPSPKVKTQPINLPAQSKDEEPEIKIEQEIKPSNKRKPTSYIEVINRREEEEYMNDLLRKQAQIQQEQDQQELGMGSSSRNINPKDFGKALLPGEGQAMAAYVAEGKRIPRRGEIGFTSDQIEKYEQQGYVMSGSRHKRMEAVRARKENQIYSAEEKRMLEMLDREQREKKTKKLQSYLTQMIEAKHSSTNDKD